MIAFKIIAFALTILMVTCRNLQTATDLDPINLAELETPDFLAQVDDAIQKVNSGQTIVSVLMNLDDPVSIWYHFPLSQPYSYQSIDI